MLQPPLILTLRLLEKDQQFFNQLRKTYFPPERNYLNAHLSLFHQLEDNEQTIKTLKHLQQKPFMLTVSGLMFLGFGVAYRVESAELNMLRGEITKILKDSLIPQDLQPYRPHITIQNKVSPQTAKKLKATLESTFQPFIIKAIGLDLWTYLGGPWEHHSYYPF